MYGLIGKKLGHSFSEKIFKEKFANKFQFKLIELESISNLTNYILDNPMLKGFSVTIPYKKEILPFIDSFDDVSKEINAVNTVLISRNNITFKLKGYNTDEYGFTKAYFQFFPKKNKNAIILGTGGAAYAVNYALKKNGIETLMVSRTKTSNGVILYSALSDEMINSNKIIVNATSLGMFPNVDFYPLINYCAFTKEHIAIDLTYNPNETMFMKKAKEFGAKTFNGYSMLQQQAHKAWGIWGIA